MGVYVGLNLYRLLMTITSNLKDDNAKPWLRNTYFCIDYGVSDNQRLKNMYLIFTNKK